MQAAPEENDEERVIGLRQRCRIFFAGYILSESISVLSEAFTVINRLKRNLGVEESKEVENQNKIYAQS